MSLENGDSIPFSWFYFQDTQVAFRVEINIKKLLRIIQIVPVNKQILLKYSIFVIKEVKYSVTLHTQFVLMEQFDVVGMLSKGVLCCCCFSSLFSSS